MAWRYWGWDCLGVIRKPVLYVVDRKVCRQNKVAVILLVLGIVFLCTGAAQGGYQDAFRKAVRVCLECIGIG